MKKKATAPASAEPGLMLADIAGLTAAATADMFAAKMKVIRRAFVENGKLIHHLDSCKLRPGQSVYGMLQSRGVSQGSIHSARTVANLITALVVPGLIDESKFDAVITFRTARLGDLLLKGNGAVKMEPAALATVLQSGDTATVASELECLHEHGVTTTEREAAIAAEAEERKRLEAAAAEAEKLKAAEAERIAAEQAAAAKAEAERQAAAANAGGTPTATGEDADSEEEEDADSEEEEDADSEEEEDADSEEEEDADSEEEEDADSEEEEDADPEEEEDADPEEEEEESETPEATTPDPVVVDGTKPAPKPLPAPPKADLTKITDGINALLIEALELDARDMEALVAFLRRNADDFASTLSSVKAAA